MKRKRSSETLFKRSLKCKVYSAQIMKLPCDVLIRVLQFVNVQDIGHARQVCKAWMNTIDEHAPELWISRCNALGLLPIATQTLLSAYADLTKARARAISRKISREDCSNSPELTAELARVYRAHYFTWLRHVCKFCEPLNLDSLCKHCTAPNVFEWCVSWPGPDSVMLHSPSIRHIEMPIPPHAPDGWSGRTKFYRYDEHIHILRCDDKFKRKVRKWNGPSVLIR